MTAPGISQKSPLRSIPSPKSKLLLVADSPERLKKMKTGIGVNEFEITGVCSVDELRTACRGHHDLAVFDVEARKIKPMLTALRASAGHKTIMALVDSSRLDEEPGLAGLLPTFRAMPCHEEQLLMLMRHFGREGKRAAADKRPVLL